MFSSNSRPKFYDDPTAINLLKAMSKSVSIISGHPLFKVLTANVRSEVHTPISSVCIVLQPSYTIFM